MCGISSIPLICTEIQDEHHKQMEDSHERENFEISVGIKHVQDKCEKMCNATQDICMGMWQDYEEKFNTCFQGLMKC